MSSTSVATSASLDTSAWGNGAAAGRLDLRCNRARGILGIQVNQMDIHAVVRQATADG